MLPLVFNFFNITTVISASKYMYIYKLNKLYYLISVKMTVNRPKPQRMGHFPSTYQREKKKQVSRQKVTHLSCGLNTKHLLVPPL